MPSANCYTVDVTPALHKWDLIVSLQLPFSLSIINVQEIGLL